MITKPTVLVLGSGASIPYGFPSGKELLETIHRRLNPKDSEWWMPIFNDCGIDAEHIEAFRWELYYSQQSSVDAFLERRPEFLEVGKLTIALNLVQREDENWLLRFEGRDQGFYQYLFNRMATQFEDFGANKLTVITFNYDRSFEHYLFKALQHSYGKPAEKCASILSKIPVIHVHGSLGLLPWQTSGGGRPYIASYGPEDIQNAAKQIIIVSEGQETSSEFKKAFHHLKEAYRVYFLGFGYNDTNLKRLRLNELPSQLLGFFSGFGQAHMKGSAYGLEYAETESISSRWQIVLPDTVSSDCLLFLRRHAELD